MTPAPNWLRMQDTHRWAQTHVPASMVQGSQVCLGPARPLTPEGPSLASVSSCHKQSSDARPLPLGKTAKEIINRGVVAKMLVQD